MNITSLPIEGHRQPSVRRVHGVPGDPLLDLLTGCPAAQLPRLRRPAVLAGVDIHGIDLQHQQRLLLEPEGWPFATSLSGKSPRSEQHSLDLGAYAGVMGPTPVREEAMCKEAMCAVAVRAVAVCEVVQGSGGPLIPGMPLGDLDTGDAPCRSIGPPSCRCRRTRACTGCKEIKTSPIR